MLQCTGYGHTKCYNVVVIISAFISNPLKDIVCDFHQYLFINTSVIFMFTTPNIIHCKEKGKAIPVTGHEGPQGCKASRLPHFLQTIGSQMAVRLLALRAGHLYPPGKFLVPIFVRSWVDPRAIVQLEGLGKLGGRGEESTSSGLEPATFRLVALCLNQLRYCVPPLNTLYPP
jgi:hypothetical protein